MASDSKFNKLEKKTFYTSVSEWKYIIASDFKFKLLRQPALPIMDKAQASWVETSGAWWIFFMAFEQHVFTIHILIILLHTVYIYRIILTSSFENSCVQNVCARNALQSLQLRWIPFESYPRILVSTFQLIMLLFCREFLLQYLVGKKEIIAGI